MLLFSVGSKLKESRLAVGSFKHTSAYVYVWVCARVSMLKRLWGRSVRLMKLKHACTSCNLKVFHTRKEGRSGVESSQHLTNGNGIHSKVDSCLSKQNTLITLKACMWQIDFVSREIYHKSCVWGANPIIFTFGKSVTKCRNTIEFDFYGLYFAYGFITYITSFFQPSETFTRIR